MSQRNLSVETAVSNAIDKVDLFISGGALSSVLSQHVRDILDQQMKHRSGSVRIASLFFVFYACEDTDWDCDVLPTGLRGEFGDKKLANEFNRRHITLHKSVTAFGENLGWKGNVSAVRLSSDGRFSTFSKLLKSLAANDRQKAAEYLSSRFAASQHIVAPLPPVGSDVLTYSKSRVLFSDLLRVPSEGNIQQFLIAAMLSVHRKRYGHTIKTHHAHASDKFDQTYGDIEEFRDEVLIAAYEVTVRPDWKNRISDFKEKMDRAKLSKYAIIASAVNTDDELAAPADMLKFVEPYGRDLVIIDIQDVVNVFSSELTAAELRETVNLTHSYLCSPKLCGRADIIDKYTDVVSRWIDDISD